MRIGFLDDDRNAFTNIHAERAPGVYSSGDPLRSPCSPLMPATSFPVVFKYTRTHSFCAKSTSFSVTSEGLISYRGNIIGIIEMALEGNLICKTKA